MFRVALRRFASCASSQSRQPRQSRQSLSYIREYINKTGTKLIVDGHMSSTGAKLGAAFGFIGTTSSIYYDGLTTGFGQQNSVCTCMGTFVITSITCLLGSIYYTLPIIGVAGGACYVIFEVIPQCLDDYRIVKRK